MTRQYWIWTNHFTEFYEMLFVVLTIFHGNCPAKKSIQFTWVHEVHQELKFFVSYIWKHNRRMIAWIHRQNLLKVSTARGKQDTMGPNDLEQKIWLALYLKPHDMMQTCLSEVASVTSTKSSSSRNRSKTVAMFFGWLFHFKQYCLWSSIFNHLSEITEISLFCDSRNTLCSAPTPSCRLLGLNPQVPVAISCAGSVKSPPPRQQPQAGEIL